jgi:hypothetical protein
MARSVLKDGSPSESTIQKSVINWLKMQKSMDGLFMKIPNEGKRTASYGRRMREEGMLAGAFDIFITLPAHGFHGMWLELKSRQGKLSLLQHKFKRKQESVGYYCVVCYDIDDAIENLTWFINGYRF